MKRFSKIVNFPPSSCAQSALTFAQRTQFLILPKMKMVEKENLQVRKNGLFY